MAALDRLLAISASRSFCRPTIHGSGDCHCDDKLTVSPVCASTRQGGCRIARNGLIMRRCSNRSCLSLQS